MIAPYFVGNVMIAAILERQGLAAADWGAASIAKW